VSKQRENLDQALSAAQVRGLKTFGLANILDFEYAPKLQSLL
jgi:hypothetical protein